LYGVKAVLGKDRTQVHVLRANEPVCSELWSLVEKLNRGLLVVTLKHFEGNSPMKNPPTMAIRFIWGLAKRLKTKPDLHVVVVSLMNPFYDIRALPPEVPVLIAYDDGEFTLDAIAHEIRGTHTRSPPGMLPFDLGAYTSSLPRNAAIEALQSRDGGNVECEISGLLT